MTSQGFISSQCIDSPRFVIRSAVKRFPNVPESIPPTAVSVPCVALRTLCRRTPPPRTPQGPSSAHSRAPRCYGTGPRISAGSPPGIRDPHASPSPCSIVRRAATIAPTLERPWAHCRARHARPARRPRRVARRSCRAPARIAHAHTRVSPARGPAGSARWKPAERARALRVLAWAPRQFFERTKCE